MGISDPLGEAKTIFELFLVTENIEAQQMLQFADTWTRVPKQPIIALYFESENELKFYNLEA